MVLEIIINIWTKANYGSQFEVHYIHLQFTARALNIIFVILIRYFTDTTGIVWKNGPAYSGNLS